MFFIHELYNNAKRGLFHWIKKLYMIDTQF